MLKTPRVVRIRAKFQVLENVWALALCTYKTVGFRAKAHKFSNTWNFDLSFNTLGFFSMLDLVVSLIS